MIYTGCNQRIPEYHSWVALNRGMDIQSYVELGCGSASFLQDAGVPKVVTVDLLQNGQSNVHHIQGNSHELDTLHQVLTYLGDRPECVFIDADHTYNGVRFDFDVWYPVATRLVGFHDILMPGVMEFWLEVSRQYPSIQIISRDIASANKWQHGCQTHTGDVNCGGIGVIFKEIE
jgi:hypothetical protein